MASISEQIKMAKKKVMQSATARFRTLDQRETEEFSLVLDDLNGTKESIMQAKLWAKTRGAACQPIASLILAKAKDKGFFNFDQKLFLLYLVNDILHEGLNQRTYVEKIDSMSLALLRVLPELFELSVDGAGESEKRALKNLLTLWYDRLIFNKRTIDDLEKAIDCPKQHTADQRKDERKARTVQTTLNLTAGYALDLSRGTPPYTPLDPRRIPAKQEKIPLEYDLGVLAAMEAMENELRAVGVSYDRTLIDFKREFYL